jgi:hypothetical protein
MSALIVSFDVWGVENGFKVITLKPRAGWRRILRPAETEYVAMTKDQLVALVEKLVGLHCSEPIFNPSLGEQP